MKAPRPERAPHDLKGQQRDADREAKDEKTQRLTDQANLRWVMSDAKGRAFVARILRMAGVEDETYTGAGESTVYREGRRTLGVELQRELKSDQFELFVQMIREHQGKQA